MMKKLPSFLRNFDLTISALLLLAIFADILIQIYGRVAPGTAPRWTIEMGSILMCAMIWMGVGSGVRTGSHIRFDMIIQRFSPRTRKFFDIMGNLVFLLFVAILSYYTWNMLMWYFRLGNVTTLLRWNKGWTKMPMLIGLLVAGVRLIHITAMMIVRFNKTEENGQCPS